VFVRVRSSEREAAGLAIMRECGAKNVHGQEVDISTQLAEIPVSGTAPDPLLDDERLATCQGLNARGSLPIRMLQRPAPSSGITMHRRLQEVGSRRPHSGFGHYRDGFGGASGTGPLHGAARELVEWLSCHDRVPGPSGRHRLDRSSLSCLQPMSASPLTR
jgi:hypothetical protein